MTSTANPKPALKVAPAPDATKEREARDATVVQDEPGKPMSTTARILRGFFQLLLPLAVIAGGVAAYQYLLATKPDIPKRQARPNTLPIATQVIHFADYQPMLKLFGTTVAGRQVEIRSLVAGKVVSTADGLADGGKLAAGATILAIDPFDYRAALDEADAQLAEARARISEFKASLELERGNQTFLREQVELAEVDLKRAQPLSRRGAVSERTVDDRRVIFTQRKQALTQSENNIAVWQARLEQQEATVKRLDANRRRAANRLAETKLVAPFNAYVTNVGAQVGRMLGVNDRVATLIDRDWIEVAFTVTDQQFGRLARGEGGLEGRSVEVLWRVGSEPLSYKGRIARIGANVSSEAGGVQVYARVDNPAAGVGLRPGAFVEVSVPDTSFSKVARLPSTAIFDGDTVYVVNQGVLASRKVSIVATSGPDVLVRGPLEQGDKVMITRVSLPGDGVRVREVTSNGG